MNASLAQTFDSDAQGYDAHRPGYPEQLFQTIFNFAQLEPDARCLEIGAGTGQATQAMLAVGLSVEALEPGVQLAAELMKNLRHFPQLTIRQCRFEDFQSPAQMFDLIYSASAFHWVPKRIAYRKAFDLLKPGGTLALFWHSFSVNRPNDPTHQALQKLFEGFNFGMTELSHDPERYKRKQNSLAKRGYSDVRTQIFRSEHLYPLEQFLGLLSTTFRFRMLAREEQERLNDAIQRVLSGGTRVLLDQTCDLYLGRRTAKPTVRDKIQA
ncbi:MAG: methyltransferase domain-containing protein [Anaerolineaceae bacterium]